MLFSITSRLLLLSASGGLLYAQAPSCLIQPGSAGPVHLGASVTQVRQTLRGATVRESQDGDGLPLLQVIRDGLHRMDLYLDEGRSKIDLIRVFDGSCATRDGVHPGMPLSEVARRYGRMKRLTVTEIESREYATFEKLPNWLGIQVGNGQAGVYAPGKRCTTNYSPSAHIASLWVSHPGAGQLSDDDSFCTIPAPKR